jgi:peptidoglycan hydrolase-like protein with peptidoglycan-binding domain
VGSKRTAIAVAVLLACAGAGAAEAANPQVAGLQVALKAHGLYTGPVDGVSGPGTVAAVKLLQARKGLAVDGRAGTRTRAALGPLGRPLLGRRDLARGAVGFDVSVLQYLLLKRGFCSDQPTGAFDVRTAEAVKAFQRAHGLVADGIAGARTLAALAGQGVPVARRQPSTRIYVVRSGDHLTAIADRFGTTVAALAKRNRLDASRVLLIGTRLRVPGSGGGTVAASAPRARPVATRTPASSGTYVVRTGDNLTAIAARYGTTVGSLAKRNGLDPRGFLLIGTRLRVPATATASAAGGTPVSKAVIRDSLDRWSSHYGVDAQLVRALAWQESGFQNHVVSSAGARGVMQLLPVTMDFVQNVLLMRQIDGATADGNVQMGVRLLAHLIREWDGDLRLALAAWYQGSKAVRERGVYKVSEAFVANVLALRGQV